MDGWMQSRRRGWRRLDARAGGLLGRLSAIRWVWLDGAVLGCDD